MGAADASVLYLLDRDGRCWSSYGHVWSLRIPVFGDAVPQAGVSETNVYVSAGNRRSVKFEFHADDGSSYQVSAVASEPADGDHHFIDLHEAVIFRVVRNERDAE